MNKRQREILRLIAYGGYNSTALAQQLEAPEPSIRRSIQTLRSQGWNISFADEKTGVYSLRQTPAAAGFTKAPAANNAFDTNINGEPVRG